MTTGQRGEKRPYISGFCTPRNPESSHKRCDDFPRSDGVPCTCYCHEKDTVTTHFAAGFYPDVDEQDYHSGVFGPAEGSLSQTGIKLLLKAPALFKWHQEHPMQRDAFDFGSAAHALALGRGMESIYVAPYDDWTRRKGPEGGVQYTTDEKKIARADGLSVILPKEWEQVCDMAEALSRHKLAMELLSAGEPEVSMYAAHERTGVWMRGRFDYLTADDIGVDYKALTEADPGQFGRAAVNFGYAIQDAYYNGISLALGRPLKAFAFVTQMKEPPYLVSVVELDSDSRAWGRERAERGLEIFRDCRAADLWPGFASDDTFSIARLPQWAFYQELPA